MKHLLSLLCLCALGAAQAQLPAAYDPAFDARERSRIDAERSAAVQLYGGEEADCYQRFAVNDCLREVRKRRRVVLEELRRQEVILNDAQRAAVAAEQQRRIEQRQAERMDPAEQARRDEAQKAQEERVQGAQQRQSDRTPLPAAGVRVPRPPASSDAAVRRAEQQKAYEERQRNAEQRRRAHEKEQAQQGPRTSQPLPVPP